MVEVKVREDGVSWGYERVWGVGGRGGGRGRGRRRRREAWKKLITSEQHRWALDLNCSPHWQKLTFAERNYPRVLITMLSFDPFTHDSKMILSSDVTPYSRTRSHAAQQNRSEKHQACYIKETEDVGGRKISAWEELEAAVVKVKKRKKERKKEKQKKRKRRSPSGVSL